MPTRYFTQAVFEFLEELALNNNKPWWEENKERYINKIREPALDFVTDFGQRLEEISPHFVADPRVNGGSLMRPYRDMRFAKGEPYKTNVGIQFRHEQGKDVHAPGFYLHIEPGQSFAGVGLWNPETKVARAIRQSINDDPATWGKAGIQIRSGRHGRSAAMPKLVSRGSRRSWILTIHTPMTCG